MQVSVLHVLSSRHVSPYEILLVSARMLTSTKTDIFMLRFCKTNLQEKGSPATAVYLLIHGEIETWSFEVSVILKKFCCLC